MFPAALQNELILFVIFSFLDLNVLVACKSACRRWILTVLCETGTVLPCLLSVIMQLIRIRIGGYSNWRLLCICSAVIGHF